MLTQAPRLGPNVPGAAGLMLKQAVAAAAPGSDGQP